ncbi:MAG: hypothetical protein AAF581_00705 [Planctomycetota bacterium]
MTLSWTNESPAYWDAGKQEIVGDAPEGIFELPNLADGDVVPGDWWRGRRRRQDGRVRLVGCHLGRC